MKTIFPILLVVLLTGCTNGKPPERKPVAEVGKTVLYFDEIPVHVYNGSDKADSLELIQNYINTWARRQLLLMKAEENLTPAQKNEVDNQLGETRANLLIHQYQQQMLLERMDTVITESELENFYITNDKAFMLSSNIVKALFIKVPLETPGLDRIKTLARSNNQTDLQQLESVCFQFAEKYDDFNENWLTMDKLEVEIHQDIENEENFLRWNTFYETADSSFVYLISIRDYRLRSSLAPFEYVRDDIKRIIWNRRRIELILSLENGLYNDALKEKKLRYIE
ncbi:MAG TPA: hypothetical protein VHO46_09620 [Bacteroidales bacterium]|nr:hypothetical protein [Bacteroidales bacterium]